MPRGRKKNYKGAHRHFTDPNQVNQREEKEKKERDWRRARGEVVDSDESRSGGESGDEKPPKVKDFVEIEEEAVTRPKVRTQDVPKVKDYGCGAVGDMPPSESDSDSDPYDEFEDGKEKHKGVEHLIALENPNLRQPVVKNISALDTDSAKPELTRKQREELQKQQAKANYMKAHLAGKTDEAQADMARLALIRKEREEANQKREAEKKVATDKKNLAEKKLLEKKKNAL